MRMVRQRRAPRVQHRHEADAGAQMPARGRDLERGLRRRLEQQIVDDGLVGVGNVGDRRRQGVDNMEVRNGKQLRLPLGEPLACCCTLTLGAVPVAAAVEGDHGVSARSVLAARNMPAERRCPAALDRTHHLHLATADVPLVGFTPRGAVIAENVRDLQSWTLHDPRPLRRRRLLLPGLGQRAQIVERAHHAGDHARGHARVARCRLQLVVSEQRLDGTNIHTAIE